MTLDKKIITTYGLWPPYK